MRKLVFVSPPRRLVQLVATLALVGCGEPETVTGPFTVDLTPSFSTVTGDLVLSTQAQVDALSELTEVTGNLTIQGPDIENLTPLSNLTSVWYLTIYGNAALSDCVCGLYRLLTEGSIGYGVSILDNAPGCNSPADVLIQDYSSCCWANQPPTIESIVVDPQLLWPANNRLRDVRVLVTATDPNGDVLS